MNVNPHLHYLQQQSQQGINNTGNSPQIAHLQMQQQMQQYMNQLQLHLSQLIGTPTAQPVNSANPMMGAVNGVSNQASSSGNMNQAVGGNPPINPVLQLQLQQQLQQKHQQLQLQSLQPSLAQHQSQRLPDIKEVWSHNLEYEFQLLRSFINDKSATLYIAIHQEIPGIVARPVGTFKSSSDYHFQTLRTNSDLLNLIQLSLCVTKVKDNEIGASVIWQFNFQYDLSKEMYNEEHLAMLSQTSLINFQQHVVQGISHFAFAELMIDSGLLLDSSINWISYHSGYDLGFLISLLTNNNLPIDEQDFYWWCAKYFPDFYDLKLIGSQLLTNNASATNKSSGNGIGVNGGNSNNLDIPISGSSGTDAAKNLSNNKPSIEYLAEELHLLPISPQVRQHFSTHSSAYVPNQTQQQMPTALHAYLSMECFKELVRQLGFDRSALDKFKGVLWGLGNIYANSSNEPNNIPPVNSSNASHSTKGGAVHLGRPVV